MTTTAHSLYRSRRARGLCALCGQPSTTYRCDSCNEANRLGLRGRALSKPTPDAVPFAVGRESEVSEQDCPRTHGFDVTELEDAHALAQRRRYVNQTARIATSLVCRPEIAIASGD